MATTGAKSRAAGATYGRKAAGSKQRSAFSFDFDSPVKDASQPATKGPIGSASGSSSDPFDFDDAEDASRGAAKKLHLPRSPPGEGAKRSDSGASSGARDPDGQSPSKRVKVDKDVFSFDSSGPEVSKVGSGKSGRLPGPSRAIVPKEPSASSAAAKPPPAKTAAKGTAKSAQPAASKKGSASKQPAPAAAEREPSPDPDEMDPWELPNSTSAKEFPSQPGTPTKKKPTTPKKKQPTLVEKLLSSPVKDDGDYFEVSLPAHLLRPPLVNGTSTVAKRLPTSDSEDEGSDTGEPGALSQRSTGSNSQRSNSQRSNPSASQRARARPASDPFSLLETPAAPVRRGVAARMKAANGVTIDPLLRSSPTGSPEPTASAPPKQRTPKKPEAAPTLPPTTLAAPAPIPEPDIHMDARDAEMQRAIMSVLSAPNPGKAISGITKMIGSKIAQMAADDEEEDSQGAGAGSQDSTGGFGADSQNERQPGSQSGAGSGRGGVRTYGRSARAGGMAGAASARQGISMDLATVADMGVEKRVIPTEEEDDDDARSKVASKHELSISGATRMFIDGVEYLLDGLAAYQPVSTRRSSGIELVRKLATGSDYVGKLRAHGFVSKIVGILAPGSPPSKKGALAENDPILLACAGVAVCAFLGEKRTSDLAGEEGSAAMKIALAGLTMQPDPLGKEVWGNKTDKAKVKDLRTALSQPGSAWAPIGSDPSLRALSIVSLEALFSHRRDLPSGTLAETGIVQAVCDFLSNINEPGTAINLYPAERALRILEAATMLNTENQAKVLQVEGMLETLVGIMGKAAKAGTKGESQGIDCHIAVLKTLVNLSSEDQSCTRALCAVEALLPLLFGNLFTESRNWDWKAATAASAPAQPDDRARDFDVMVLILCLLVNLATMEPEARDKVRELKLAAACPRAGKCAETCACPKKDSALVGIVDLFKRCRVTTFATPGDLDDDERERDRNVLLSYLALLIGCLIRDNSANLKVMRPLLPGGNFATLRKQLEDFAANQRDIVYSRAQAAGEEIATGDQVEKDVLEMVELLRTKDLEDM